MLQGRKPREKQRLELKIVEEVYCDQPKNERDLQNNPAIFRVVWNLLRNGHLHGQHTNSKRRKEAANNTGRNHKHS
jgi:hypothetical protein